jgi:anti-anti-sigma factor
MTSDPGKGNPVLIEPVDEIVRDERGLVVRLCGELDLHSVPVMRKALLELEADAPDRLVVDLSGVDFIDSTSLGVLVEAKRQADSRGRILVLAGPGSHVRRALSVSGLDRHLSIAGSVEEALAG